MLRMSRLLFLFVCLSLAVFAVAQEEDAPEAASGDSTSVEEAGDAEAALDVDAVTGGGGAVPEEESLGADILSLEETIQEDYPFLLRLGIALAIVVLQILLICGIFYGAKMLERKLHSDVAQRLKAIRFKNIVLLESKQIATVLSFGVDVLKWAFTALLFLLSTPNIFRLFRQTREIAAILFDYILSPIKRFAFGFIAYIPNLFTIVVIILISRYVIRALKFFSTQLEKKKLVLRGFYPEWAQPTFNILRVLVIAFTVAMVYPNLPNSDSDVFKGVSVLVGVLFSLGSSSVVSNLISGIVMTYMRPFHVGDRIKINDITGFVIERGPMVVRIRTHKNEIISFPNQMVMNNSITNYTLPASESFDGLVVHASITMGYDVPWTKVHEILLAAADRTENTEKTPIPFVNQLKLDDFYCLYEINVYTRKVAVLPSIYTNLYKNIQDGFSENGISMYAPHFQIEKRVETI